MLLNRVELGENRVIYNRLRNIGPATAGSAGPVPAPLKGHCIVVYWLGTIDCLGRLYANK